MNDYFPNLVETDYDNKKREVTDACSAITLVRYADEKQSCRDTVLYSKVVCLVPENSHKREYFQVPGKEGQFVTKDPRDHGTIFYSDTATL
jgi:hypothetical protein